MLHVAHDFLGHVRVADGALGVLDVLHGDAEVVARVFEAVLVRAQIAADGGDVVDGPLDDGDGVLCTGLGADVHVGDFSGLPAVFVADAHGVGVHVVDDDLHTVVGLGGVADLQNQTVAAGDDGVGGGGYFRSRGSAGDDLIRCTGLAYARLAGNMDYAFFAGDVNRRFLFLVS